MNFRKFLSVDWIKIFAPNLTGRWTTATQRKRKLIFVTSSNERLEQNCVDLTGIIREIWIKFGTELHRHTAVTAERAKFDNRENTKLRRRPYSVSNTVVLSPDWVINTKFVGRMHHGHPYKADHVRKINRKLIRVTSSKKTAGYLGLAQIASQYRCGDRELVKRNSERVSDFISRTSGTKVRRSQEIKRHLNQIWYRAHAPEYCNIIAATAILHFEKCRCLCVR